MFLLTSCPAGQTRVWLLVRTDSTVDVVTDTFHATGKVVASRDLTGTQCASTQDGFGGWDLGTPNADYSALFVEQQCFMIDTTEAKGASQKTIWTPSPKMQPGKKLKQLENVDYGSDAERTCYVDNISYYRIAVCHD